MREIVGNFLKTLLTSKKTIVLTGAGVSTASGIPDFRGPKGIYTRLSPRVFDINWFYENPEEFYKIARQHIFPMLSASPNPCHRMLSVLEEKGLIEAVITQNIDGLHQKAGSRKVIELHGTIYRSICTRCSASFDHTQLLKSLEDSTIPRCSHCGGLMKPDVVFFGENLPADALQESFELAEKADLCIAMGTSLVVYPAAMIPEITHNSGGKVIIVNRGETGLDHIAYAKYNVDLVEFSRAVLESFEKEVNRC